MFCVMGSSAAIFFFLGGGAGRGENELTHSKTILDTTAETESVS